MEVLWQWEAVNTLLALWVSDEAPPLAPPRDPERQLSERLLEEELLPPLPPLLRKPLRAAMSFQRQTPEGKWGLAECHDT